mgnify:CR=1 FL=1
MSVEGIPGIEQIRQPEYTGDNRCLPCTAVNGVIAVGLSVLVAMLLSSPVTGVAVACAGAAAIYLRGYLVPGTPELTTRYLPERVLRWFDKPAQMTLDTDVDAESQLRDLGLVEPAGDDLRLTESAAAELAAEIERVRRQLRDRLEAQLNRSDVQVEQAKNAYIVRADGDEIGRWPSRAALVADLASLSTLERRVENWATLSEVDRSGLSSSLRLFLEDCPECDGLLEFVETRGSSSCCRDELIVSYRCTECNAVLTRLRQS